MSDPLISPGDLAIYLNDTDLDTDRATTMIADAQTLCESIISPLPAGADVVVKRVAGRGYITTMTTRGAQMAAGGSPGVQSAMGGVWISRADRADLRRLAGGGGAYSVNLLAGYTGPALPPWDAQGAETLETS